MAGNVYMLAKEGEVVTNDDISAFFLQTSIQEALKSGDSTLIVPVLQFPCLYKGQLVRVFASSADQSSLLRQLQPLRPSAGVSLPLL